MNSKFGPGVSSLNLDATVEMLAASYRNRTIKVGIVGLGYVGVPLAIAASRGGFRVLGFDNDPRRVDCLNRGESGLKHIPPETIKSIIAEAGFSATADLSRQAEVDAVLITVPTPLSKQREPDLSCVIRATEAVAKTLRKNQLVILESSTYPGTTRDVMKPILEAGGMKSGVDFFVAYSPEREDPGNPDFETTTIPRVVGGDGVHACRLAKELYSHFVDQVVTVSSVDAAEAAKLMENIFRAVNVALVNELKMVFTRMGIDIWEVIEAAKTKPFGYMPFYPGPGLGGHCIPIDPFYLTWKAREFDMPTRFIELAGEINTSMPYYVIEQLAAALDRQSNRGLCGAKVLVVGLSYKKNIDDLRQSPALRLITLIEMRGGQADYHDDYIKEISHPCEIEQLCGRKSVPLETAKDYDVVLIATDHDYIDYAKLAKSSKLLIDTRNACGRRGVSAPHIWTA